MEVPPCNPIKPKPSFKPKEKPANFSYNLNSLDLTDPYHSVQTRRLSHRIEALNLSITPKQMSSNRIHQICIPYFHISQPKYGPTIPLPGVDLKKSHLAKCNNISCHEAEELIKDLKLLEKYAAVEYNSLPTILGYIEHFKKHPESTPSEAFRSYEPNSSGEIERASGTVCSGVNREFVEILRTNNFPVHAYPIVERAGPLAIPNHAAAVVPCNDGILFIELLNPQKIVSVKAREVTNIEVKVTFFDREEQVVKTDQIVTAFKVLQTTDDYDVENLILSKEDTFLDDETKKIKGHHSVEYLLRPIKNPDSPVMTRYMLVMPVYPVIAKSQLNGDELTIKVNFNEGNVVLQRKEKETEKFSKVKLPFALFDAETQTIDVKKADAPLSQTIEEFLGPGRNFDKFWDEFQAPQEIKNQLFILTKRENLQLMNRLYAEVKQAESIPMFNQL